MVSIINDTTGTLIASHYVNPQTRIACIFGTGCNAAYMEHIGDIPKINHLGLPADEDMAINCEYGAFDSFKHEHMAEIRTKYDEHIDLHSNKPHEQSYEKMIAGLYLGELFRLCICDLIDEGVLFLARTRTSWKRPTPSTRPSSRSSSRTPPTSCSPSRASLRTFSASTPPSRSASFFRKLAKLIGTRSARLSSCGIAALVTKMGYLDSGCGVGADGSLYSKYPRIRRPSAPGARGHLWRKGAQHPHLPGRGRLGRRFGHHCRHDQGAQGGGQVCACLGFSLLVSRCIFSGLACAMLSFERWPRPVCRVWWESSLYDSGWGVWTKVAEGSWVCARAFFGAKFSDGRVAGGRGKG